jgi:uncharacterized phosphosugar-binding protein
MLGLNYLDELDERLAALEKESPSISNAAKLVVESVLDGGRFCVYDSMDAISNEAAGRAGGLFMVKKLRRWDFFSSTKLASKDVVAFFTNGSNLEGELVLIDELKSKGVKIIGVFPRRLDFPGADRFRSSVDQIIDNALEDEGGIIQVAGFGKKIGPLNHVINTAIMFSLCVEIVGEFLERKLKPSIYLSMRMFEADEHNSRAKKQFQERGF